MAIIRMTVTQLTKEVFGTSKQVKSSKHVKQAIRNCKSIKIKGVTATINDMDLATEELLTEFRDQKLKGKTRRNGSALAEVYKHRAEVLEREVLKLKSKFKI